MALMAGGVGVIGALGVGSATTDVASAATTTGTYHSATPLGNKAIPVKVTTLRTTTPKTVPMSHKFSAKPKLTATIPASLIKTAHTAAPTLTSLAAKSATLDVTKHNFSGPASIAATKKPTITTNVALALINTTTIHHGAVITVTYTAVTFTVTSSTGKATLTPDTLDLYVEVPLTCYPPSKVITFNTPTTVTLGYTVTGTNTLHTITTVNATAGLPAPTVTKVTPSAGPAAGGTPVTITGSGFVSGGTTVTFGGTTIPAGSVTFVSTSQIKVTSPSHGAGTVTVTATTTGGTSAAGDHFTYVAAPTVTKVTPSAGPTGGGTIVTLTGSGFASGATTVTFGGTTIPAGSVTFVSTSQIKVTSPSHSATTVTVKATTTGGTSASGEHFTYEAVPTITKVTPSAGPTGGGTTVTITGSGFVSGATTVTFGGTTIPAGSVTFVSTSRIKVSSPSHSATTVTVKATTAGGTSASGEHFTYVVGPTISKVTPSAGPTGGGTIVTLTGSGFASGATTVTFGGTTIPAGSVTFVSTTQIKVTSPSHSATTVTVKATTTGGTSASGEHFTYEATPTITKVTPSAGPTGGGTSVTLTGSGFVSGATTVTFGGTVIPAGSVTFVSTSRIKVSSPSHGAGTVTLKATTAGGTSAGGEHFTYQVAPTVTKVTPSAGPTAGGTTVTLTGTGFETGILSVKFGTTTAHSWTVTSPTTIVAVTESHSAATVTVTVTTPGGTSASGEHFTFQSVPSVTKVTPSAGPTSGGTNVTLTGSGFVTGATSVTFGGTNIPSGSVTFVSTSQIKVSSPSHGAGTVTVTATTSGGTSGSGEHFTYEATPTVTRVTPATGPTGGGTTVTLTGSGFVSGATTVTFGGTVIPAGSVTFVSTSRIKVSSPSHGSGTVTVKATTAGGTSAGGEHFSYVGGPTLTKVTPNAGPIAGGTTVTLTGSGFASGATTVTFGGTVIPAGSVTFVSASKIKVSSPSHSAATVTVTATTAGGTSSAKTYTYDPIPTITKVTPAAGPTAGGTMVTLTGTGFVTGSTTVKFGTTTAHSWTVTTPTTIVAVTESHSAATVTVKVTTPGGTSGSGEHFTFEVAPTVTKVTPSAGPTGGGTIVTLTGSGFVSGATTVTFGGTTIPAGSVTFVSTSKIKVSSPSHAATTVTVKASTAGGTSAGGEHFTYEVAPTVTNVTPSAGPTGGGTSVTLTGSGFVSGATTVTFGGTVIPAGSVTFVSTSQVKVSSPSHTAATVTVTATTAGGTSASGEHFTYVAAPTITKVTPGAGSTAGGTTVTLTGSGFVTGATTVTFGGTVISAGSVTFVSTTQIKVSSPSHSAATVTVKATTAGGTSASGEHFVYGPPSITKITPPAGPTAGGNTVTLTGSGYVSGGTTVTFGGTVISAGSVTFVSTTEIKVSAPSHGGGTVTVKATTAGGTSAAGQHYVYGAAAITNVTPSAGPTTGGTTVTITGTSLTGATQVHFGTKTAASFHVTSSTKVTAVTKAHPAGPVVVTVTTPAGTATWSGQFTYETPPTITSFTPTVGTTAGGNSVAITGTGFRPGATTVKFGTTTAASVHVIDPTDLIAVTKPHAAGTVTISVATAGGQSFSRVTFTFLPVPTLTKVTPSAGKVAGGTSVTLTGTGFVTGVTSVKFGTTTASSWTVTSPTTIVAVTEAHAAATVTVTVNVAGGISDAKPYSFDPVPTLSAVTPPAGKLIGGTVVTLTGSGFRTGATTVTFGAGNHGTTVHVSGTTTLTVKTPGHATGTVTVTVTTPGGTSGTQPYTYDPIPTLSSVTPSAGKLIGGTVVTLTGTGFRAGATTVTFGAGNHGTTVHVTGTTTLTVTAPGHAAGTVTVTVATPGGTSGSQHYTYDAIPTLTKVTPSAGKLAGGTVVTLTGTGFVTGASSVKFGTTLAHSWTVTSPTKIVAVTEAHLVGTVTVTVTTPGGTSGDPALHLRPDPDADLGDTDVRQGRRRDSGHADRIGLPHRGHRSHIRGREPRPHSARDRNIVPHGDDAQRHARDRDSDRHHPRRHLGG